MHYPFEIQKRFTFDAAHDLPQMPEGHKCKRHHGHTYEVEVSLSAMELDADGFVQDFGEIARIVKSYIDTYLDHRDLSQIFGGRNTTAERLAVQLFYIFKPKMCELVQVAVRETPNTCAKFRPQASTNESKHEKLYWLQHAGIDPTEFAGLPQL